ncbi:hypothetical protein GCM10025868_03310 [Angustibacter aerolatus]|uniref:Imidazole glycerol phosphate synthase subunit HisF n=1 Tax=Angustibacter aerolatus TaxID=1162965 RepID=A0ABQ6JBU9_9ACTN|nr:hypothetical protein GCM10025868_03310 [Angustibacter aerolatus]
MAEVADRFGAQVLVLSLDVRRCPPGTETDSGYEVTTHGGRRGTGLDAVAWAARVAEARRRRDPAQRDGRRRHPRGLRPAARRRGQGRGRGAGDRQRGAGSARHFAEAADAGADAVLAASVFHFGDLSVRDVKRALADAGHPVR